MHHILLLHSSVDGDLVYIHMLSIMNRAFMEIQVQALCRHVF